MYSRHFSDRYTPPPEYGGTAFAHHTPPHGAPPHEEPPCEEAHREEHSCEEPSCSPCLPPPHRREEAPCHSERLLRGLLPSGISGEDLLLLGLALLLLLDGCEDRVLPYLLLFLLVVRE